MVVAPPVDIGANGPNHFANNGVSNSVVISRIILASKAMVPSSAPRYSVMKILDSECKAAIQSQTVAKASMLQDACEVYVHYQVCHHSSEP